jgi:hypothetical protein
MALKANKPLSLREQVFIAKYEEFGGGKGAGTPAAIAAGYKPSFAAIAACRLLQREPVAREIQRRQKIRLRALHSKAIDAIEETLDDKSDPPTRLRAANQVLNRTDPSIATTAHLSNLNVTVRQESNEEMELKALRLLRELGATREMMERMLGPNTDLLRLEQQLDGRASGETVTLEATAVEVPGEVLETDDGDD